MTVDAGRRNLSYFGIAGGCGTKVLDGAEGQVVSLPASSMRSALRDVGMPAEVIQVRVGR